MKDFELWLSKFKSSIADYKFYVDFDKVYLNANSIKTELHLLNSLIGSKNIEDDFETILNKYPSVLSCIPILLAKREMEIYAIDGDGEYKFNFLKQNYSTSEYKMFMRKTGLFELIENRIVNNLYDYVLGVETGLSSNGRKNRGGHLMEDIVENYLIKSSIKYDKEMSIKELEKSYGVDLSNISNDGKSVKRFDFVVKTDKCVYAIECNFYSSGGSKLNETARSYKMIALESKNITGFKFVWFTDGVGWISARNNLRETFEVMEHLYSINDLENGIIEKIFK